MQSCDLSIYEDVETGMQCLRDDRPWKPLCVENSHLYASQVDGPHFKHVRAVTSDDHITEFLIDSGSDATVVPISYAQYGIPYSGESRLVDCQGNALSTVGLKEFRFIMQSVDGRTISFKEVGHLSSSVSCPLVSFGRLFKNGWRIGGSSNDPLLEHSGSGVAVSMSFRNESFVVPGFIRQLAHVNAVSIKVPEVWKALNPGWHMSANGLPLCRSNGARYIDASKRYSPSEFPFRTTICLKDTGWEMVEHCARYANKDPSMLRPLEARAAISVFSREWVDIEEMGLTRISSSSSSTPSAVGSSPDPRESSQPLHPRRGVSDLERVAESGGFDGDVAMHESQGHAPAGELPRDQLQGMQRPDIPDAAEQHVSVRVDRDSIEVNGLRLTAESPIATLRAACKYIGVSSSGGKKKLFDRVVSFYDQQQLSIAQEVQASLEAPVVTAKPQIAVQPPTPAEVRDHQLTHIPYQQWCEACVQGKARPDSHVASPERRTERSITRLSFDLSFTGRDHRAGGPPRLVDADEVWSEKIVVLNCHDSATGMVAAIPVRRKGDIHYMAREVAKFARSLGVGELELHCDNEPTMLQLLSLLQRTLIKLGLVVTTSTSKPRDHGGNAYAEQTVHRVRQNAMVLLAQVEINLGHSIPINHPISTWAFKHSAWIINRFIGRSGQTPYFLVHGHDYTGKCCPFGEVVMAYVADDRRQKGSARWAPMVFLGKTENDMFIVGLDKSLRVTRSIKRIFTDMKEHLGTYQTFNVMSWMIEGTLGTRLRPGMPRVPAARTGLTLEDDPLASDVEAQAVRGYVDPESGSEVGGIDITTEGMPMMLPEVLMPVPGAPVQSSGSEVPQLGQAALQQSQPTLLQGSIPTEVVEQSVEMADVGSAVPVTPDESTEEPSAKRARLSTSRVSGEEMVHVDETGFDHSYLNFDNYDDFDFHTTIDDDFNDYENEYSENEVGGDPSPHVDEHLLWHPISPDEPLVDDEILQHLDDIADAIEISRLKRMHVLEHETDDVDTSSFGSTLTAKFVRTWRKKPKDGVEMWLRRSRLVAREFNRLELRDDLFSTASNHVVEKVIPALAVSKVFSDNFVMGSLDIGDAYLQVPQSNRRRVKILGYPMDMNLLICRCLPGQRDGSRRWFDFFTAFLTEKLRVEQCAEQPAMFRIPASDGGGVLLVHVDDVLFLADSNYVNEKLMPVLKASFKVSMAVAPRTPEKRTCCGVEL